MNMQSDSLKLYCETVSEIIYSKSARLMRKNQHIFGFDFAAIARHLLLFTAFFVCYVNNISSYKTIFYG